MVAKIITKKCPYPEISVRLWLSRKSEGRADFCSQTLLGSAQTFAAIACRAARKSGNNFPTALKFAGQPFQQGISDSHSLLEFSAFLHGGTNFARVARQPLYKAISLACSRANGDRPVAAILRRRSSGGSFQIDRDSYIRNFGQDGSFGKENSV